MRSDDHKYIIEYIYTKELWLAIQFEMWPNIASESVIFGAGGTERLSDDKLGNCSVIITPM